MAFLALRKWKLIFFNIKVGNFLWHNCLTWEDAPVYKIWAHYLKKWHGYGLALGHLDWKPWMFIHDWPYWEAIFFKKIQNSSLSFFMASSTHKRTTCERIAFFWVFVIFFDFFQNRVKFVGLTIRRKKLNQSKLSVVLL